MPIDLECDFSRSGMDAAGSRGVARMLRSMPKRWDGNSIRPTNPDRVMKGCVIAELPDDRAKSRRTCAREHDGWHELHKLCDAKASTANKRQRAFRIATFELIFVPIVG
ncbi:MULTISPECIES: hypothetical protein [unclassified Bradyrhizobium]|uniref:hypothetical protein n=1 Tax=Bradyrhizobium sp. USDA 4541 TaxID=2817704 RepID=UPI0020A24414|nr:hypothetical protein [Bradyrhizobium sp. USDA 4541]MCP1848424.1 hypothetical protein [Bradyrhizobium sp. USDA 4541]